MNPEENSTEELDQTLGKIAAGVDTLNGRVESIRARMAAKREAFADLRARLDELRKIPGPAPLETPPAPAIESLIQEATGSSPEAVAPPAPASPVKESPAAAEPVSAFESLAVHAPVASPADLESLIQAASPPAPEAVAPPAPASPVEESPAVAEHVSAFESLAAQSPVANPSDLESLIQAASSAVPEAAAPPVKEEAVASPVVIPAFEPLAPGPAAANPALPVASLLDSSVQEPPAIEPEVQAAEHVADLPSVAAAPASREAAQEAPPQLSQAAPLPAFEASAPESPAAVPDVPMPDGLAAFPSDANVAAPEPSPLPAFEAAAPEPAAASVSDLPAPEPAAVLEEIPAFDADKTVLLEPVHVVPEPVPALPEETAALPAASAASSRKVRVGLMIAAPVVCLLLAVPLWRVASRKTRVHHKAAKAAVSAPAPAPAPAAAPEPAPAPIDEKSAQALALVQQWHMAGDDKSVFQRLGSVQEHPGGVPAWSTEMTDDDSYLVIFREVAGTPIYAFEVDMKAKKVLPTPEATDRLTLIRVRDAATDQLNAPYVPIKRRDSVRH